ncbi:MAG: amidase [bacterium]|nr:amidase [bacterium]
MVARMSDELAHLDATAQADLVARGDVTAKEMVEAAIARIDALDPQLNAVIHRTFEKARTAALGELPKGPFCGVPFLVKDAVCQTEGDPYHLGMKFLKDREYRATHDSELARRFRAAGFVFVGKTNTPELAMSATTEPEAYGATHNPWAVDTSTGGSSGGSAAAVASGMVAAAHANDMGGSIRIPASFCGLVGLKPTRARGSLAPDFGEYWGPLTHEHVVTRSVRDSAAILDAVAGPACGDPYSAPVPSGPWRTDAEHDPTPLRVGLLDLDENVDPTCRDAAQTTAAWLEALGHRVEPLTIACLDRAEVGPWIPGGLARDLDRWSEHFGEPITQDDVEPINWMIAEAARRITAPDYIAAAERAFAWARQVQAPWSETIDILITPTSPIAPPKLGWVAPRVPMAELLPRLGMMTRFTMAFDITGQPAISLPLHTSEDGLPIGVQLVAGSGREDLLFQLAGQLERTHPWAARRPHVHA